MLKKLLIANRGEIALRIVRCCRDLGIDSVVVYAADDAMSLPVRLADAAYPLTGERLSDTYLNGQRLIEIAKTAGCQAIHPGYGFLAENSLFAQACATAGIDFIGPTAESIQRMGDKVTARQWAMQQGVPVIPGTPPLNQLDQATTFAKQHGYPLLIKCSGGGGGHGMRKVMQADAMETAWREARAEGEKAFGSSVVYLEKAIIAPRHVEVQLFGFGDGRVVHLFTRDCSMQRRYQKIVEEAPAPQIDATILERMATDACRLAASMNYRGAGTMEFLYANQAYYFLEMNTRLQVEHPVTEMILGVDLVAMQLQLAMQNLKDWTPPTPRGHAIECRLYAEDPQQNFIPSPGRIHYLRLPSGPGIRVDCGIEAGYEVSIRYDPMLAKIIAYGENREIARLRLIRALDETAVIGITTNLSFLQAALQHPDFITCKHATDWLNQTNLATATTAAELPTVLHPAAATFAQRHLSNPLTPGHALTHWSQGNKE